MSTHRPNIDGVLLTWGDRLFYGRNRVVHPPGAYSQRARQARQRIEALVNRRPPEVMVKITGGGRGMGTITAHFNYISKHGKRDIEDDQGEILTGKHDIADLAEQWRLGGTRIDEVTYRREAFNIMLSMPKGTNPEAVREAARGFARTEFADHRYVMVLHDHQTNPHVHLCVRAESRKGVRLNPKKRDLQRWREIFADRLRDLGIDAEATLQPTRGQTRAYKALWRIKAEEQNRERKPRPEVKYGERAAESRAQAVEAWGHIAKALAGSPEKDDRDLALAVTRFVGDMPAVRVADQRVQNRDTQPQKEPVPPKDIEPPR